MLTFKVLSALLSYPEPCLQDALGEAGAIVRNEAVVPAAAQPALLAFLETLRQEDVWIAQERYVALFDRVRSLSLHLYEHVHGESRDRGQAMVDLAETYRMHGLEISKRELPDYLPLFLEFLAELPLAVARAYLVEAAPIIAALRQRLEERESPYAAVMASVGAIAAVAVDPATVADILAMLPPEDDTPAALDRRWEEEAVSFLASANPTSPACGRP
jgi:nitrate reductase delta subunit